MKKGLLKRQQQSIFDNDPAIEYDGEWVLNNFSDPTVNPTKMETSHSTGKPGSSIFVFFSGMQITVSGTIPAGEGAISASYCIDNGQPITVVEPAAAQDFLHQTLFQSSTLGEGTHNLTVMVADTGTDRNYTFQQFTVTDGSATEESVAQAPGPDGQNAGHSVNAAAIVGGVLGTVILLLLSVFVAFYFRRKKRLAGISNNGEHHLPPMACYARPVADGFENERPYDADAASEIDTDSKVTFAARNDYLHESNPSWVPVNLPPSVIQSALVGNRDIPGWSTYKGSSMILPQAQAEHSRFSPYTSTTLSSMAFREPTPQFAPRTPIELPFKKGTRSSSSSL